MFIKNAFFPGTIAYKFLSVSQRKGKKEVKETLHCEYGDNVLFRRNQRLWMFSRGSSRCNAADKLRASCSHDSIPPKSP